MLIKSCGIYLSAIQKRSIIIFLSDSFAIIVYYMFIYILWNQFLKSYVVFKDSIC